MSEAETGTGSEGQTGGQETSSGTEGAGGGQQQQAAAFYDAFPDDLKAAPAVVKYKSVEELARGLVAAENRLGVPADQLVRLPKGMDDKEGLGAVMKALGAPDTVDGYKLEMGEGATDDAKTMGLDFIKHMHEAVKAPPVVIAAAFDWFQKQGLATQAAETAAAEAAQAAGETALKAEWGAAYDVKFKEVGRLLTDLGGPDLAKELATTGIGNNPKLMSALGKLLDKVAEPGGLEGQGRGTGQVGVLTPAQAKVRIAEIEADPIKGAALRDPSHSMHKAVVDERTRLFGLAAAKAS